jgi:hypothetical protein
MHLQGLRREGFRIPIDLECYFSDEVWEHAKEQGWLEEVDLRKLLSEGMMRGLANGEPSPLGRLQGVQRIGATKNVRREDKITLAQYVLDDEGRARRELEGFRGITDGMLRFLLQ